MPRLLQAALIAALALLLAGAALVVYRLTEFSLPTASRSPREPAPPDPPPQAAPFAPTQEASPYQAAGDPTAPIVVPAGPAPDGPIMNESRPIQGPAPVALPADPAERQEALQSIRSQRVNEQMERLNKRNRERIGAPPPPANAPRTPPAD